MPSSQSHDPTNVFSPSSLNNRGVLLIEAQRFADAARCFKEASTNLISVFSLLCQEQQHQEGGRNQQLSIATNKSHARNVGTQHSTSGSTAAAATSVATLIAPRNEEHSSVTTSSKSLVSHLDGEFDEASKSQESPSTELISSSATLRNAVPSGASEIAAEPSRKRKISPPSNDIVTRAKMDPVYCTLGRPLWIQRKEDRKRPLKYADLSSTILYNLGLCFHSSAVCRQATQQQGNIVAARLAYRRALDFYQMVSDIAKRRSRSQASKSPVLVVTLHNMVQAHTVLNEIDLATTCQTEVAQLLRLLKSTQGVRARHYERFLIGLLSLPKATNIATAA